LKKDAVVSSKVRNRSLRSVDFAAGELPAGPAGPQGPGGQAGPPGFSSLTYVATDSGPWPAHAQYGAEAVCGGNLHAVGGGVVSESGTAGQGSQLGFTVFAICAPAGSVSGP
jgi:hypothetical protein